MSGRPTSNALAVKFLPCLSQGTFCRPSIFSEYQALPVALSQIEFKTLQDEKNFGDLSMRIKAVTTPITSTTSITPLLCPSKFKRFQSSDCGNVVGAYPFSGGKKMPATKFMCPNGQRIRIVDCLRSCPNSQRCMFLPTLRAVADSINCNIAKPTVT